MLDDITDTEKRVGLTHEAFFILDHLNQGKSLSSILRSTENESFRLAKKEASNLNDFFKKYDEYLYGFSGSFGLQFFETQEFPFIEKYNATLDMVETNLETFYRRTKYGEEKINSISTGDKIMMFSRK